MAEVSLSVVVPVFNEADHVAQTVAALLAEVDGSGFDAQLVVVDDGSADGSADAARAAVGGRLPLTVITQPNRGRYAARSAGLAAAEGELVLLLDSRVRLSPGALRFARERVERGERVWNGHVEIASDNVFGIFWRLLAELAWRDYFDDPRTTSFGSAEFDRYPKGTTCFLAPRDVLEEAFAAFRSRYPDPRLANDDTPILRAIAARERIAISPTFACTYEPRTAATAFVRHAFHRGIVFVDGHGTPDSRFFPFVAAFFPLSAAVVVAALRRPAVAPAALAATALAAAAYGFRARRTAAEIRALALATPVYALGHGLGMWRGLAELVRGRVRA